MRTLENAILHAKDSAKRLGSSVIIRRARNGQLMHERESFLLEAPLSNIVYPRNRWLRRVHPDGRVEEIAS